MGGTIDSMCSCEKNNLYKRENTEILREFPKEINQTIIIKSQSKNKELKNSFQNSGKITQFISPNKMEEVEEENNLLNTAKNTMPSNNAMSNRSNAQNNSIFFDIPLESIEDNNNNSHIIQENKKNESLFGQMSKIEDNEIDTKILYTKKSKKSLRNLINVFNFFNIESKLDDTNININKNKEKKLKNDCNEDNQYLFKDNEKKNSLKKLNENISNKKLNGFCKYTDENGNYYEGIFNNGELNGNGKIIKIKENNDKDINSTKQIINKITYKGNIKNFKKEGYGNEICNEYIYEGNFHNDMKNGKGKIKFIKTGDYYEGDFTDDKITGYGKYIWSNKHEYIGDFNEGEMNGKGIYKWPDGSEYEGEYINNKREGKGKFKWSNGAIFEGIFHDGKPDGKGIMNYKGNSFNSEFKKGHFKISNNEK